MDKAAVVASAVLVSALHLLGHNAEIVKRWTNEIQEAVQSKHTMVQFHGVALLHALRANDRLAVSKLVTSLTKSNVRSSLAQCLLVRYMLRPSSFAALISAFRQPPFADNVQQAASCLPVVIINMFALLLLFGLLHQERNAGEATSTPKSAL